jgi:hypothetical protein
MTFSSIFYLNVKRISHKISRWIECVREMFIDTKNVSNFGNYQQSNLSNFDKSLLKIRTFSPGITNSDPGTDSR